MDTARTAFTILLLVLLATSQTDGEESADSKPEEGNENTSSSVSNDMLSSPVAHQVASPGRVSATEPYIDSATPLHVTAYAGIPAMMRCQVNNLGQRSQSQSTLRKENGNIQLPYMEISRQVSWVRHQDIHVLTVGRFTFTNDDRFEAQHDDGSNEWVLKLKSPTVNDSGTYECQINTKPTISQLITLTVLEPKAIITAGQELYVDRGSTLRLTCTVVNAPAASDFLLWYHKEKLANFNSDQVTVSVEDNNTTSVSTLILVNAQPANSGIYTCSPSNATPASIRVHVLSGEHPAAMQTNSASSCLRCSGSIAGFSLSNRKYRHLSTIIIQFTCIYLLLTFLNTDNFKRFWPKEA